MLGALGNLILNLLGLLLWPLATLVRMPRLLRPPRWVRIELREPLPARPPRRGWLVGRHGGPSLAALAELASRLGRDRRLTGVVVRLEPLGGGWAKARSVRDTLSRLRAAGKRVVVHLSSQGLRDYYVASAGDTILVDESGPLALTGLAAETLFFGGALARAGVKAEAEYRGAYKSFAEVFTRDDMSPAHREALDAILDRLEAELVDEIAAARRVSATRARELLTGGPYPPAEAARRGLVDGVRYLDQVPAWLASPPGAGEAAADGPGGAAGPGAPGGLPSGSPRMGAGRDGHLRDGATPAAAPRDQVRVATVAEWHQSRLAPPRWRPLLRLSRRIRVVTLHGNISPGEGAEHGAHMLGAEPVRRVLEAARQDRRVAAVVLHVNSRGGSATASDLMWRDVALLAAEKPVVAYLDDVAASGGYYLACAATRIVAQPTTLTGSIGVVAGKLSFAGLYERLGLRVVALRRGDVAGMHTAARGYSEEERRRLATEVDALYQQFVGKVAAGRKLALESAEAAAQGRVWLGSDARERGLVDELGDAEAAVRLARELGRRHPREKLPVDDAFPQPRHRNLLVRLLAEPAGRAGGGAEPDAAAARAAALALVDLGAGPAATETLATAAAAATRGERALFLAPDWLCFRGQ